MSRSPSNDLAACIQALQDILAAPERAQEIAEAALAHLVRERMGLTIVPEGKLAVKIPALPDGAAAGWAKWVLGIDLTGRGGYLFEGPFLPLGKPAPLPPGAVVIVVWGGTKKNPTSHMLTAYTVQRDGALAYPVAAVRPDWPEVAKRIEDYLKARRALPLLTEAKI